MPDKEFIIWRNKEALKLHNGIWGADCQAPEYHQAKIDKNQILITACSHDTLHSILGELDYKNYAKAGVKIGDYCLEQIRKGIVKYIVVWEWVNNNQWEELHEGIEVSYRILGIVDAKKVLNYCEKNKTNRFPFCKKRGIILETEENYA